MHAGHRSRMVDPVLPADAGVIHEDVDPTTRVDRRLRDQVRGGLLLKVGRHDDAVTARGLDRVESLLELGLAPRRADYLRSLAAEQLHRRSSYTAARAGNDGDLVVETAHGLLLES